MYLRIFRRLASWINEYGVSAFIYPLIRIGLDRKYGHGGEGGGLLGKQCSVGVVVMHAYTWVEDVIEKMNFLNIAHFGHCSKVFSCTFAFKRPWKCLPISSVQQWQISATLHIRSSLKLRLYENQPGKPSGTYKI